MIRKPEVIQITQDGDEIRNQINGAKAKSVGLNAADKTLRQEGRPRGCGSVRNDIEFSAYSLRGWPH